jgi:hypothetical protein
MQNRHLYQTLAVKEQNIPTPTAFESQVLGRILTLKQRE